MTGMPDQQKRVRGGQPQNGNARKHGLHQARRMLSEFGQRAIDGRSALGRALAEWKIDIVKDLGGPDALSAQQYAVLDVLLRTKLMLDGVDNYILSQGSLVNRRKKSLHPVVRERDRLADTFVRHMQVLGLNRVEAPKPSLQQFLAQRDAERSQSVGSASTSTEVENAQPVLSSAEGGLSGKS